MRLLRELRRRRVFRSAAIYAVFAWSVLVLAPRVVPGIDAHPSLGRLVSYLLAAGFALAVAFSWLFQVTAEHGVRIEHGDDRAPLRTALGLAIDVLAWSGLGLVVFVSVARLVAGADLIP